MDNHDNCYIEKILETEKITLKKSKKYFFDLRTAYLSPPKITLKNSTFNPITDKIKCGIDNLYTSGSYINTALNKLTTKTVVTLPIKTITITLTFYHINDFELITKCIMRTYSIISTFGFDLKIYDGMTIDMLLYDAPRIMTSHWSRDVNEIIEIGNKSYFNCVCGYATVRNDKFNICVTRKGGCLGLLTHELGHVCGLDCGSYKNGKFSFPDDRFNNWKLVAKKYFDVNGDVGNLFEGINNGNSSIIHAMCLSLETDTDTRKMLRNFHKFYTEELLYSIKMTVNLLKWYGYSSANQFINKNNRLFIQTTQMLEYILVRCVYLLNFEKLGMIDKENDLIVNDDNYIVDVVKCLKETAPIIDAFMKKQKTNEKNIVGMEYYYNC